MPRRIKKHLVNTRRRKHHGGGKKKGGKTLKKFGGNGNTRQRKHYRGSKKWRTAKRKFGGIKKCDSYCH